MIDRENPFAAHRAEALAFRLPAATTWPSLMDRLGTMGYCGAVVGRRGSGKSCALEDLQPFLWKLGFEPRLIRLSNESSMREKESLPVELRKIEKPCFILLDGAEQLSTRHWLPVRAAASQAAGFVVTVHRVSRLPVWLECNTTPGLLSELVEELTGEALPKETATDLIARHFGDIRECLRELHRKWEARHGELKPAGV